MCWNEMACAFLNEGHDQTPELFLNVYRRDYCEGNPSKCARMVLASRLGPRAVPTELGPHQAIEAMAILAEHGEKHPSHYFL